MGPQRFCGDAWSPDSQKGLRWPKSREKGNEKGSASKAEVVGVVSACLAGCLLQVAEPSL